MKNRKSVSVVILVASLLLAVTLMDTWILFAQTHRQTRESGIYQLESMSGRLESTISDAENLTMELAIRAREHLSDRSALEHFIYAQKKELLQEDNGAFNVYIADEDYAVIPGFDQPEDYVASERVWYTGALKNRGKTYVSSPYQDAMTGEICYTVSVMLGDHKTVLAVDYTLERIREYIEKMTEDGVGNAVIVTDEGIIAGCSDSSLIGKRLTAVLPDYAGVYSGAKNKNDVVTGRIRADHLYENLFATRSGNGWYLIVSESDWEMYRNSYLQLLVTAGLSLALFAVIIVLYLMALKSQQKAERALASKEEFLAGITAEFHEPLKRILDRSEPESGSHIEDYETELAAIHAAGMKLSDMVSQIMSYTSIVRTEKEVTSDVKGSAEKGMNKRVRTIILSALALCLVIGLYTNVSVTWRWGKVLLQSEVDTYDSQLSEWINTQKTILDMFVSEISTNPDMLSDYPGTVAYLNRITEQYPEISVTYMTNPSLPHTVYMNNGWQPGPDWKVEERAWYIDTLASERGWSVSAPYYDEQTGGYCITISEVVYDARTGDFLGIFGIDFFMDKLVGILDDSYTETGYAFLVDPSGEIINHPYGSYQMSQDGSTNVTALSYSDVVIDSGKVKLIHDYDGSLKLLLAKKNQVSGFSVYAVSDIWKVYGRVIVYAAVSMAVFLACMIFIYRQLSFLIRWQDETNRKVREAADTAIAAGKAKSQFLAQMSHEIRTPINAVLGMNEMILRESLDEHIRDYAGNIQSAGRTLLSLINSILDFSKIEDGKMELVQEKYDLASVINDIVNSISERARKKGLAFHVNVEEELPSMLYGDDVRIRQVLMNLLTNAVKYTETGSVTLTMAKASVHEGQESPSGQLGGASSKESVTLAISVRDTGIGIQKEDMGRLFESFERLDEQRNRNIEGTGLGMSIVTKLLAMMGSELTVDSVYGEGSVFSFRLRQEVMDPTPIGDFSKRLMRDSGERGNEVFLYAPLAKVLVVDDNDMNLKVMKGLLKRNGIVPELASSGADAVEMMRRKQYDLVFLDHMMPGMDGIETLKKLRKEHLVSMGSSVVALTANAVSGAKEKYLSEGFDDYLSKPIEIEALEKKLRDYIPAEFVSWKTVEEEGTSEDPSEEENDTPVSTPVEDATEDTEEETAQEFAPVEDAQESSTAEDTVLEFAPVGDAPESSTAEDTVLEFAPVEDAAEGNTAEDAFLEFAPVEDTEEEEILEFSPSDEEEILEFSPTEEDSIPETAPEKAEVPMESSHVSSALTPAELLRKLSAQGVHTEEALEYFGGDPNFYLEMLRDYVKAFPEKQQSLDENYETARWHDFETLIHAAKSTSRMVGLSDLADRAFALEQAANREDARFIWENYPVFDGEYTRTVLMLKELL